MVGIYYGPQDGRLLQPTPHRYDREPSHSRRQSSYYSPSARDSTTYHSGSGGSFSTVSSGGLPFKKLRVATYPGASSTTSSTSSRYAPRPVSQIHYPGISPLSVAPLSSRSPTFSSRGAFITPHRSGARGYDSRSSSRSRASSILSGSGTLYSSPAGLDLDTYPRPSSYYNSNSNSSRSSSRSRYSSVASSTTSYSTSSIVSVSPSLCSEYCGSSVSGVTIIAAEPSPATQYHLVHKPATLSLSNTPLKLERRTDYNPAVAQRRIMDSSGDEQYFDTPDSETCSAYIPLSSYPTPPVEVDGPIPINLDERTAPGSALCLLANLPSYNANGLTSQRPLQNILLSARITLRVVAIACLILRNLSASFTHKWGKECDNWSYVNTPELIVVGALSVAMKFDEDRPYATSHWARQISGNRFHVKEVTAAERHILADHNYEIAKFIDFDLSEEELKHGDVENMKRELVAKSEELLKQYGGLRGLMGFDRYPLS